MAHRGCCAAVCSHYIQHHLNPCSPIASHHPLRQALALHYTSAPRQSASSVYPVRCPTNAPERDVLRRSPPTGCVVGLGYHTSAWCSTQRRCWLRLSQFSRPSCTTLAAPIFGLTTDGLSCDYILLGRRGAETLQFSRLPSNTYPIL